MAGVGLAARVAAFRPYFQLLALLSLGASYYWVYKKQRQRLRKPTPVQLLLWGATLLFLADFLPSLAFWLLRGG